MMKAKQGPSSGLGPALDVVGGRWKVLILWEIHAQPRRFGELKRLLPSVSEKVLTQQLRELARDGIVHREVFREVPPRVEYSITELGAELSQALDPLREWAAKHMTATEAGRTRQG